MSKNPLIGQPASRVDGPAKVTGTALYAAEFAVPGLAYGVAVTSAITRGRITRIHADEVRKLPGVLDVFSHENRLPMPDDDASYRDQLTPKGAPFRPFYDDAIKFNMQPVALVVAETFEQARYAAAVLRVEYDRQPHYTDLTAPRVPAALPEDNIGNFEAVLPAFGQSVAGAWSRAPHRMAAEYVNPTQHHNPMEPFAATAEWLGARRLTVYDKTQGTTNSHQYLCKVFDLAPADVRVISKFTGGAFGVALRPQYHLYLAALAALRLSRSVRVSLTRQQLFGLSYRPAARQQVRLATNADGSLAAVHHEVLHETSEFEEYAESIAQWSAILYKCDHVQLVHRVARLDLMTPAAMRAPGPATGSFALEVALDEMACEAGLDPVELRLRSYADHNGLTGKPFSSKSLRACYQEGAARFGWAKRTPAPRSMRRGNQLVGWGMAGGIWDALQSPASARATLQADGQLVIANRMNGDIGTGTSTIVAQVAAETLGLPLAAVTFRQGESALPDAPMQGGSWTAGSVGSAVQQVCQLLGSKLLALAQQLPNSPLAGVADPDVEFVDGRLRVRQSPAKSLSFSEVLRAHHLPQLVAESTTTPDVERQKSYAVNVHNAVFAEVLVDEDLGTVRVTRVVEAVAAGRILNPKTARSQIMGAIVWGISTASAAS